MAKDIGALWTKTNSKGEKYLSGIITFNDTAHQIAIFKNGFKEKDNQPDWKIYASIKKELNPNGTEKVDPNEPAF